MKQDVINKSVEVDVANQRTTASLPLMNNPSIKLAHNKERALKVYNHQIEILNQNTDDGLQNFIPWRAVWNGNSISTPC